MDTMYSLVCKGWRQHEAKNKMDGEPKNEADGVSAYTWV